VGPEVGPNIWPLVDRSGTHSWTTCGSLLVGPKVGPLVGPEVGPDVGPLVGPDAGRLVGPKVGPDVGPLVSPEVGPLAVVGVSCSNKNCRCWEAE
jgi:hypothetical protein